MKKSRAKVGVWGQQMAYRHGAQGGYVEYGGRKVKIKRPRVRGKDGAEVNLETYRAFQGEGKMLAQDNVFALEVAQWNRSTTVSTL